MKYLFNTAVTANVTLNASLHDQNITATVRNINPLITVTDTKIGNITEYSLNLLFKIVSHKFIIPNFNELGAEGLPLPGNEQIAFVNATLNLVENALMLGTDLVWHPKIKVNLNKKTNDVENTLYYRGKSFGKNP